MQLLVWLKSTLLIIISFPAEPSSEVTNPCVPGLSYGYQGDAITKLICRGVRLFRSEGAIRIAPPHPTKQEPNKII